MASRRSVRPFGAALALGLIVGGTGIAVRAMQADDVLPAAKSEAMSNAKTIDPSTINTDPVSRYESSSRDEGVPAQVAQVKEVSVTLFGDYYSLGAMSADFDVRHEQIFGAKEKAARAEALARVWDSKTYEAELSLLESGFATFDRDTSSIGYSEAKFVVISWQKVTVRGARADVNMTGYILYADNDGSTHVDETKQWQLQLVRGGDPDNYRGWRIVQRDHAELPEGVSR